MKHKYILTAMALTSILLAGCDSDSSDKSECTNGELKADCHDGSISKCVDGKWTQATCDSGFSCNAENQCGECKNDEVKTDCADGKYSKCVNGKWTKTDCANGFSCNAENQCGECKDGDEKADCNDGKVSRCINGKYQQADCENNASCTTDNKCGECKNGDTSKCTNDSMGVGSALVCKDGSWSASAEKCPGMFSCSMTDECYQCYSNCKSQFTCNDDCKDTTCKAECDNYSACIKQCDDNNNGCDSKCGECVNEENINCTENNGVGFADICFNGKWASNRECKIVRGIDVSCKKRCNNNDGCNADEDISVCGDCKNSADRICIESYNNPYDNIPLEHTWELVFCKEGALEFNTQVPCDADCKDEANRMACLQTQY